MKTSVCPIQLEIAMKSCIFWRMYRSLPMYADRSTTNLPNSDAELVFSIPVHSCTLFLFIAASAKSSQRCVRSLARSLDLFCLKSESLKFYEHFVYKLLKKCSTTNQSIEVICSLIQNSSVELQRRILLLCHPLPP